MSLAVAAASAAPAAAAPDGRHHPDPLWCAWQHVRGEVRSPAPSCGVSRAVSALQLPRQDQPCLVKVVSVLVALQVQEEIN